MSVATAAVVADTHVLIWYVLNSARLSKDAVGALEGCVAGGEAIRVSAYSLIELVYAVERTTNPFSEEDRRDVLEVLQADDSPFGGWVRQTGEPGRTIYGCWLEHCVRVETRQRISAALKGQVEVSRVEVVREKRLMLSALDGGAIRTTAELVRLLPG